MTPEPQCWPVKLPRASSPALHLFPPGATTPAPLGQAAEWDNFYFQGDITSIPELADYIKVFK